MKEGQIDPDPLWMCVLAVPKHHTMTCQETPPLESKTQIFILKMKIWDLLVVIW